MQLLILIKLLRSFPLMILPMIFYGASVQILIILGVKIWSAKPVFIWTGVIDRRSNRYDLMGGNGTTSRHVHSDFGLEITA